MVAKRAPSSSTQNYRLLALIVAVITAFVTLIPQIFVVVQQGSSWNGSYAILDFDELTYSAYVNGLIKGQPRKFNPFQGVDRQPQVAESYFSLQFLPAYFVAFPSRFLGASTSTAFIVLLPVISAFSACAVFMLLTDVTGDIKLSAVGALFVLLCGRLVAEHPLLPEQLYGSFAFARRLVPAIPFPFIFMFCLCCWRALRSDRKGCLIWSLLAGICFNLLVFSYFYLWTAAAAWLVCFSAIWFIVRRGERSRIALHLTIVGIIGLSGLIPYFVLLSRRATTIDTAMALISTRTPDLLRVTEIVAFVMLCALVYFVRRGRLKLASPAVIFCISCFTLPFIVFNQQLITGKSLQPFHYEQFIVNYLLLAGFVTVYHLVWRKLRIRPALWIIFALGVGLVTAVKEARDHLDLNVRRDRAEPVFQRLNSLTASNNCTGLALFNNSLLAASAPTVSTIPPLWAPNLFTHGTIGDQEVNERLYQYLFYLGVNEAQLKTELEHNLQLRAAFFGFGRVNKAVNENLVPISNDEILSKVSTYAAYKRRFSNENADQWPLCYLVMIDNEPYDLSHIDRWYVRDAGENVNGSIIYQLRRRN